MKKTALFITLMSTFALISCGEKNDTAAEKSKVQPSGLETIILSELPQGAEEIADARKSVAIGEKVVIKGKVMGRLDPFVEGRAIMMLGDPHKITSCDLNHDDACPTPWDVCCDDPDVIKASTLTVQVLDKDGTLIKSGIKGLAGIKELSNVVITGTVAEGSNADNMLVNATGIYVVQ